MHVLLVKVQQKILDDKVDELIACLSTGLEVAHLQIGAGHASSLPVNNLVRAFSLMLEIMAVQKDFGSFFNSFPHQAEQLLNGEEIPIDDHHTVYEQLKETLLAEDNLCDDVEKHLGVFNANFPLKRPFFEAYFVLWQQLCINELDPSVRILERLAYGTLNFIDFLVEEHLLHKAIYPFTEEDEKLLIRYNQNRVLRIDEVLMEGNFDADETVIDPNSRRIPCIKCGNYGPLKGYTEKQLMGSQFLAYGFQCNHCGMELFDQKDLLLAGIKPIYAIS